MGLTPRQREILDGDATAIGRALERAAGALEGRTLLVTGAAGFVCAHILDAVARLNDRVLDKPCRVVAVDSLRLADAERVAHLRRPDFLWLRRDVRMSLRVPGPVDYVIHGASISSPPVYRRYPLETIEVNVDGTRNALELARRKKSRSFLCISTSEIYGEPDEIPTPETCLGNISCTGPRACYGESKRLSETLAMAYWRTFGLPVKTVRLFNFYGPGQRLDDGRIVPDLMKAAVARKPVVLRGEEDTTRAFCYVADGVGGMLLALLSRHDGEAFNIGNMGEEVTIREVARMVARAAGGLPVRQLPARKRDPEYSTDAPRRRCPDIRKAKRLLGYRPRTSMKEGLERTYRFFESAKSTMT